MTIRKAENHDRSALFPLARDFATSFGVEQAAFGVAFAQLLTDPKAFLAVADEDGVIGYLLGFEHQAFFANGRVAWVEEIMVSEPHRRRGVGQKLIEAFEEWAEAREAKQIALATRRAGKFYKALGYEESAAYFRKRL